MFLEYMCVFNVVFFFFFLSIRRPPRSPLFPYTTLFRSTLGLVHLEFGRDALSEQQPDQGEQLPASLGLLPGNREARLQAPDRDVHIRGVCGDGKPCRRSEEHTSELQSRLHLVCRLLLEK